MGAQRAGPPRGDKYPLAASECTTGQSSWSTQVEYRAKYRLSYPRGRRPGAAARQSPAGTRVSSPPSALRIARAVVQALTDRARARCARSRWPPCVAAVSADPGRSLTPPRAAGRPGGPAARRRRGSRERRDRGSGMCRGSQSYTYMYVTGIARGERWSVLRACGVTRHRLRRILSSACIARRESGGVYYARAAYLTRHRLIGYDEY